MIGGLKGATTPRDLIFAATTGVLAGLIYWLVASRERKVTNREVQAKIATAISRHE